jgi:hypothetical protein
VIARSKPERTFSPQARDKIKRLYNHDLITGVTSSIEGRQKITTGVGNRKKTSQRYTGTRKFVSMATEKKKKGRRA